MVVEFTFPVIVLAAIISQGVFASLVLWLTRSNKKSNRILAALLLSLSLWLVDGFLNRAGIYGQDPDYYFLPIYYSFAFGPLIYFYVRSLTNQNFQIRKHHLLHFIPVILQAALYLFLTFQDYQFKRDYWLNIHRPYTYRLEFNGTFLSLAIYSIISFKLILRYQEWLGENFSETSKIKLNWLKIILIILLLLCVQWLLEVTLREFFDSYYQYDFSPLILGILCLTLAVGGILQQNMLNIQFDQESDPPDEPFELDQTTISRIIDVMKKNKAYLHPQLTLKEFSDLCNLPPRVVSKHINVSQGTSFIDFVNEYRVEDVKRRLLSSEYNHLTMEAIAYESGFNSKSTFNRIFKKFVGLSPGQYRKQNKY